MGGLDPPIQDNKRQRLRLWMAGSEAGHGEEGLEQQDVDYFVRPGFDF